MLHCLEREFPLAYLFVTVTLGGVSVLGSKKAQAVTAQLSLAAFLLRNGFPSSRPSLFLLLSPAYLQRSNGSFFCEEMRNFQLFIIHTFQISPIFTLTRVT